MGIFILGLLLGLGIITIYSMVKSNSTQLEQSTSCPSNQFAINESSSGVFSCSIPLPIVHSLSYNNTKSCTFTSNTFVQMGIAYFVIPNVTGKIQFNFQFLIDMSGTLGNNIVYGISYGSNSAVSCNNVNSGAMALPDTYEYTSPAYAGNYYISAQYTGIISGLTIGQRYWIDIFAESLSGTGFIINSGNIILWEVN